MGVSGAGKSVVARRLAERCKCAFADADDFHSPASIAKMSAGIPLAEADRDPWLDRLAAWLEAAHTAGRSTVLACSALQRCHRDRLAAVAPITFVHLVAPPGVLSERLSRRTSHFMPAALLESQLTALEPLAAGEHGFTTDSTREIGVVVAEIAARIGC